MEEYLRGKLEGWTDAAGDRIPASAEAFADCSQEYVEGYLEGAREALESYGSRRAALAGEMEGRAG